MDMGGWKMQDLKNKHQKELLPYSPCPVFSSLHFQCTMELVALSAGRAGLLLFTLAMQTKEDNTFSPVLTVYDTTIIICQIACQHHLLLAICHYVSRGTTARHE